MTISGPRSSGILLHPTSLPGPYGMGDLGPAARDFVDIISRAAQRYWQMLPVSPVDQGIGCSPYSSPSAFAGNAMLISVQDLYQDGLITRSTLKKAGILPEKEISADFTAAFNLRKPLLQEAVERFDKYGKKFEEAYQSFCKENEYWLNDYAIFTAIKSKLQHKAWIEWPAELRRRNGDLYQSALSDIQKEIKSCMLQQFFFFRQWYQLKEYAAQKGIRLIGDAPIYVSYDSADVWANPHLFELDQNGFPIRVAGVPPDYFSATGQRWGNPLYRWDEASRTGYTWWIQRLRHLINMFSLVRVDHFRAFAAYWAIPAAEKTAVNGTWQKGPGIEFFNVLRRELEYLPLLAEDLGTIDADVRELITLAGVPGMKVLQFAFGDDIATNPYSPHNHQQNTVVYTGTHDNNTTAGWYTQELDDRRRQIFADYCGISSAAELQPEQAAQHMVRLALMSTAWLAIIPMQDILTAGSPARMNIPGRPTGNWQWRMLPEECTDAVFEQLAHMTQIYGRR